MPHIDSGKDLGEQIVKFVSAYATVEANQAAGVYPAADLPKIEAAKAKIIERNDELCEKLKAARLHFQDVCNVAEPD